jgi:hypothetical protein
VLSEGFCSKESLRLLGDSCGLLNMGLSAAKLESLLVSSPPSMLLAPPHTLLPLPPSPCVRSCVVSSPPSCAWTSRREEEAGDGVKGPALDCRGARKSSLRAVSGSSLLGPRQGLLCRLRLRWAGATVWWSPERWWRARLAFVSVYCCCAEPPGEKKKKEEEEEEEEEEEDDVLPLLWPLRAITRDVALVPLCRRLRVLPGAPVSGQEAPCWCAAGPKPSSTSAAESTTVGIDTLVLVSAGLLGHDARKRLAVWPPPSFQSTPSPFIVYDAML